MTGRGGRQVADRRARLLAALFERPSRAFLSRFAPQRPRLAVDLGCGTGHSTRLLAREVRPERTVGLDTSANAVSTARARTRAGAVSFLEHDVTVTPFPTGAAGAPGRPELLYARFLLAHVEASGELIRRWARELPPGGRLLLDEGSSVQTEHVALAVYLEVLGSLLEHRGTAVDVAGVLDGVGELRSEGLRPCYTNRGTFSPPASGVAAMFRANLDAWCDDPYVGERYGPEAVPWLRTELEALAASDARDGVVWRLRQVALERR